MRERCLRAGALLPLETILLLYGQNDYDQREDIFSLSIATQ